MASTQPAPQQQPAGTSPLLGCAAEVAKLACMLAVLLGLIFVLIKLVKFFWYL